MQWPGKKEEPVPGAPSHPPDVPVGPKKTLRERWKEYLQARKAEKDAKKATEKVPPPVEAAKDVVQITVVEHKAHLECRQFFTAEEEKNPARFLTTERLLERATLCHGLKGDACALDIEKQTGKLPVEWRGRRLLLIGDVVGKPLTEDERVSMFKHDGRQWVHSRVPFELNLWTALDYFVCEI